MKEILKNLCDSTINNYRRMTEEFRFDGEYVNQFASLFYSNIGEEDIYILCILFIILACSFPFEYLTIIYEANVK